MSILFCQSYDTVSQCLFYTVNVMILYHSVDFIQCRFYTVNVMILYRNVEFILSVL